MNFLLGVMGIGAYLAVGWFVAWLSYRIDGPPYLDESGQDVALSMGLWPVLLGMMVTHRLSRAAIPSKPEDKP